MTIGIDLRILSRGVITGVGQYILNLLPYIFLLDKSIKFKLFYNAYHKVKLNYSWLNSSNVSLYEFKIPNKILFLSTTYFDFPKLDKLIGSVDVYFNPHFFPAPVTSNCKKVVTFHDLSFEYFPNFFSFNQRIWQKFLVNAKREAESADKIIAVSDSTKQDLIDLYRIDSDKIEVIYSGIAIDRVKDEMSSRVKEVKLKYNLPEKFILYFGTIEPRKNLIGLIKAFELFKSNFSNKNARNIKLVIAGARGWLYRNIFGTALNSQYKNDIIFTGFVEENDKPIFYKLAELFVYPSFFEGFGFPPLEAMSATVPVIASNTSSLSEVIKDGAILVDPYDINEIALAMKMILCDKKLRKKLKEKSLKIAEEFSWRKCAEKTLKVLTSV